MPKFDRGTFFDRLSMACVVAKETYSFGGTTFIGDAIRKADLPLPENKLDYGHAGNPIYDAVRFAYKTTSVPSGSYVFFTMARAEKAWEYYRSLPE